MGGSGERRDKHGGRGGGDLLPDLLSLTPVFPRLLLTQVSADTPGACPGVDYNIDGAAGQRPGRGGGLCGASPRLSTTGSPAPVVVPGKDQKQPSSE